MKKLAPPTNKTQYQKELFPIDENDKRDAQLIIAEEKKKLKAISTEKAKKTRIKKAEEAALEAALAQKEKELSKIKQEEKYKNEFPAMMQEIASYLSWGRKNDYIGEWEEENHDLKLAIYWNLDWSFDKRYKVIHKTKKFKKISFKFWLYEEVFGRLTDSDFIYPGNKDNYYDIYLELYKQLIEVTHKFLKEIGDVEQEKNHFSLKSTNPDFIKSHWDYMRELEKALYGQFE